MVDSKNDAIAFYKRFNFVEINKENSDTMFVVFDIAKPREINKIVDGVMSDKNSISR